MEEFFIDGAVTAVSHGAPGTGAPPDRAEPCGCAPGTGAPPNRAEPSGRAPGTGAPPDRAEPSERLGGAPVPGARAEIPAPGFFCRFAPVRIWRGELPHWEQDGVAAFVTFRLADSLPQERLHELAEIRSDWLARHPEPRSDADEAEYVHVLALHVERWLDAGHGECILRNPRMREIVEGALAYGGRTWFVRYASVVMPNHVHLLLMPHRGESLARIVSRIKSFTARRINEAMGRRGHVWQREFWDTLIRDDTHFRKARNYTVANDPALAFDVYR